MTDIDIAIRALEGHTIALCLDSVVLTSDRRGIAPMLDYIDSGRDLRGYSVADAVVGKAAAMLFVKAGIIAVYARTLSKGGKEVLERYGIPYSYDTLTSNIINREGSGMCPMEQAVANTEDIEQGYRCILDKFNSLAYKKV